MLRRALVMLLKLAVQPLVPLIRRLGEESDRADAPND